MKKFMSFLILSVGIINPVKGFFNDPARKLDFAENYILHMPYQAKVCQVLEKHLSSDDANRLSPLLAEKSCTQLQLYRFFCAECGDPDNKTKVSLYKTLTEELMSEAYKARTKQLQKSCEQQ